MHLGNQLAVFEPLIISLRASFGGVILLFLRDAHTNFAATKFIFSSSYITPLEHPYKVGVD